MCQRAYGNKIDPTFGIAAQSIEGDSTRRLRFAASGYPFYCFASVGDIEIIEHNAVNAPDPQRFFKLIKIAYLDFYF